MADIKQIQFKRTSVANKAPSVDTIARGELALNTNSSTLAIYTKDESDTIVQLTGKGVSFIDTKTLNVEGDSTLKGIVNIPKAIDFGEITDVSGGLTKIMYGKTGQNDGWYIGGGADGVNKGFFEIGVIDDGDEEIRFVQRASENNGSTVCRMAKILDSTGQTRIPGNLYMDGNAVIIKDKAYYGSGGADIYMRNTAGGANNQLTITDGGTLLFQSKPVYWEGRKPTLAELGINNVENYRAMKQISVSAGTAATSRFVHIATVQEPGSNSAQLDLMIGGGIDSGNNIHYTDFVYINGSNLSTFSTTNLGNYIQWRRLGNPGNNQRTPNYGIIVSGTGSNTVMDVYVEVPRYGGPLNIAVINSGGAATLVESGNDKGATKPTGYISIDMRQIFDSTSKLDVSSDTTGTLPLNRGGTGATTTDGARNALGLGTAAVRDVGTNNNQLMQVGAFGLGGSGTSYTHNNLVDLLNALKASGSQYFRNTLTVGGGVWGMGAGFYSSVADVHAAISIDYSTGKARVFAANNSGLTSGNVNTNELFGTANPPTPEQVNAVAKTGDTMTGELTTTVLNARQTHSVGQASFIPPSQGAWVNWNQQSGSGTTDFINHKGSGQGGFVFWNSNGSNNTRLASIDSSGLIKADSLDISMASNTTTNNIVSISGNQHTQLLLTRNTDANLSIGFKLSGKNLKRLGIDSAGDLRFGEADNLVNNAFVLTADTITRWSQSFGRDISVAGTATITGQSNLNGGYIGNQIPVNLTDTTTNLNDCYPSYNEPGTITVYQVRSQGGGSKITNKPSGVQGDFILTAEVVRSVAAADLYIKQTMSCRDGSNTWIRWGTVNASKSWSSWRQFVVSGDDQDISVKSLTTTSGNISSGNDLIVANNTRIGGNIGIGGASSTATNDKGIVIGRGSTLRESTGGSLILTSSGNERNVSLRPGGPGDSGTGINISSTATNTGDTALTYGQGPILRATGAGQLIVSSLSGQTIFFRTNGNANSTNEMRLDSSGNLVVNGTVAATGSISSNTAPTAANNLTRKDYVDAQVGTRLPLAGGTLTGNLTMGGTTQIANATAPTAGSHLTNKTYVDQEVTKAINGAGNLYLPLAGGTMTGSIIMSGSTQISNGTAPTAITHLTNKAYVDGRIDTRLPLTGGTISGDLNIAGSVDVTGTMLKTWKLDVGSTSVFRNEITMIAPAINMRNDSGNYISFGKSNGTENGVIYGDVDGNINIRPGGAGSPIWNFWTSGACQFPGALSNYNGIQTTTNYVGGKPNGSYNNTNGLISRFSNGALVNLYFQEYVGNYHQAILNINGFGQDNNFFFRAGGDFICTRNGSFDNVEIRSDRRAKSDIKVIENALEKVETLSGNTYELHNTSGGTTRSAGLIAQEVQEILPEAVTQDNEEDGGMLRLNYNSVIALLVESVKELSAEVKSLKAQLK